MNLIIEFIDLLRSIFLDPNTLESARKDPRDFTRPQKLTFFICLVFGMAHFTGSLPYGLEEFIAELDNELPFELVEGSTYTKAREKFGWSPYETAFVQTRDLVDDYYQSHGRLETKYGKLIMAVDGSFVALPNRKELLDSFGGTGKGAKSPTARMTIIYDSLNEIVQEATLDPIKVSERDQAMKLISNLSERSVLSKMLFIFDRGYISEELVRFLDNLNAFYLFRVKKGFNTEFERAPLGETQVNYLGKEGRLVKFMLDSPENGPGQGELETLYTNFTVPSADELKDLYFLRWPVEVEYDTIKNKIEMPNFNGYHKNAIYQNFWISMTIANLVGVVAREADQIIADRPPRHRKTKHKYKANVAEVVNGVKILLPEALMLESEKERRRRVRLLLAFASENSEAVIEGRSYPRDLVRNVKYHYNSKHH